MCTLQCGLENISPGLWGIFPIHHHMFSTASLDCKLRFFYSLEMTGRVELCRRQMSLSNMSKLWFFLSNPCSKFSVIGSGRLSFYCTPYANIPDCFWKEKVSSDNMGRIVALHIVSPSPAWVDGNFASVFIQSRVGPLLGRFGNCILSIFALML